MRLLKAVKRWQSTNDPLLALVPRRRRGPQCVPLDGAGPMSEVETRFKAEEVPETPHARWIRSLGCCVPGCRRTPIHAHHVRSAATAGTGMKPSPEHLVNCCFFHHQEGHQIGWRTWERKYRILLVPHTQKLAKRSRELGILPPD